MAQALPTEDTAVPPANSERALKILSKSIYKELRQNGYTRNEIVAFSTELLGLVTTEIKSSEESEAATAS